MSNVTLLPVPCSGVVMLSLSGNVDQVDEPLARAMGYAPAELVGRAFGCLLEGADQERFGAALARAARGPAHGNPGASLRVSLPDAGDATLELHREDVGGYDTIRVDATVIRNAIGPHAGSAASGADPYRAAFDQAFEAMLLLNADGVIVRANLAALRFFQRSRCQIEGATIAAVAGEPAGGGDILTALETAVTGSDVRVESHALVGEAQSQPVEWRVSVIASEGARLLVSPRHPGEERRRTAQEQYSSCYDPLTGVHNRRSFQTELGNEMSRWRQLGGRAPTVALINLDSFREVNAALGNRLGDEVLRTMAQRLVAAVRDSDLVARLSGDVFAVLMEAVDAPSRSELARRLLDCVAQSVEAAGQEVFVTACLGMASASEYLDGDQDLVYCAEIALNDARHRGRDAFALYAVDRGAPGLRRLHVGSELRRALQRREFRLHYQPQVLADTGNVVGLEALLRWDHPEHGLMPPGEFIPLLEESSLIVSVGDWVLERACEDLGRLEAMGFHGLRMAVNVSPRQLEDEGFVERVGGVVRAAGIDPAALELELTESLFLSPRTDDSMLDRLAALGVRLAVDDFGTGYSALAYLKRFPVKCLKIDKSFIQGVGHCEEDMAIVNAVCGMAGQLGMEIVAEGVEDMSQVAFLRGLDGVVAQGFYFAPPLAFQALTQRIQWEREAIRLAS